jgi:hypothetical protein
LLNRWGYYCYIYFYFFSSYFKVSSSKNKCAFLNYFRPVQCYSKQVFSYQSPTKQVYHSMEHILRSQFSRERFRWCFCVLKIQARMRSLIVVPVYKTLQRIKFVSPPFVQVEPFLKFTIRLRVIYARGYVLYPILFQMLLKYAG